MVKSFIVPRLGGIVAGILGWAAVWFLWRPLLNSTGHLVTQTHTGLKYSGLSPEEYFWCSRILLGQAFISGLAVSFSRFSLIAVSIPQFFFPWGLMYVWVLFMSPDNGYYFLFEELAWCTLTIVLNLAIARIHALIVLVVQDRSRSGADTRHRVQQT